MILILHKGAVQSPVPEKLRKLVPRSLGLEAYQEETGGTFYCIIKQSKDGFSLKYVDLQLTDEELNWPGEELIERILRPACHNLGVRI